MSGVAEDWAESFFGDAWLLMGPALPPPRYGTDVDLVVERLGLGASTRVLDLACGRGGHSLELARRGVPVVGVDFSEPSLGSARASAAEAGLDITFLNADMRALMFDAEFDAVVNLGSSFGYGDRAQDELTMSGVARALRPGGGFALETINPYALLGAFEPRESGVLQDGSTLVQDRRLDVRLGRVDATWTIVRPDGSETVLESSVRIYTVPELQGLLADAGLSLTGVLDSKGGELTSESMRMMLVARRGGRSQ
jgi:SAM-dependent methyltransferase